LRPAGTKAIQETPLLRFVGFLALSLLALLAPCIAKAQSAPKTIIVVDLPRGDPALDANRLRAAVASELDADAVASDDPRASRASGTLRVSIDRAAHALVVAYQGRTEPVVRKVDLPRSTQATERAAVVLAGNLARDEAGELASELRKAKTTATATTTAAPASEAAPPEDQKAIHDLNWLGVVLAHETRASRPREVAADLMLGASLGISVASGFCTAWAGASSSSWNNYGVWYLFGAATLTTMGSVLVRPGDFGELSEYYARDRASAHSAADVLDEVEQAWLRSARAERRRRRVVGWIETIGGGLLVAGSATTLVDDSQQAHGFPATPFVVLGVEGAAALGLGIDLVLSESPLESALHEYERGAERVVTPTETLLPVFVPVSGGGILGLSGRF
jgi:hypothetical protein